MRTTGAFILSPVLILLPSFSWAWSGMVVGVSGGDTIKVMGAHNKQVKIRLYGIDTPERGQAFSKRGKAIHFQASLWQGGRGEGYGY